jgi:predicted nucleic acid-binding Zn ribbon protein
MAKTRTVWNRDRLLEAVADSVAVSEVLKKLGLNVSSGNYRTFYKYQDLWEIDTGHFVGSRKAVVNRLCQDPVPLDQVLVEKSYFSRCRLRERLIKENLLDYRCAECGLSSWQDRPLSLHLDHINGDGIDNRLENLRFLCPNCHSQTSTYGGRNKRMPMVEKHCVVCGTLIKKNRQYCRKCAIAKARQASMALRKRINWPAASELIRMVQATSYVEVGRILGVSDNAVRKRIRNHPF